MKQSVRCDAIKNIIRDPKQLLISELTRQDREESSRVDIIAGRPVDQRIGASDQYIVLDSSQRDTTRSDPSKGIFAFNIVSGGTTGSNMIGVVNQLNDIIEMEVQSFPFPNIPEYVLPTNTTINNNLPILIPIPGPPAPILSQIFNNRFILQIEETSVQSISDSGGVRHNFAFDLVSVNGQLYASPVSPVYVFTDPITRFDTLTLIFRNPPVNIEFGEDTMKGARFAILQDITLTKATPVAILIHNKVSDYTGYTYDNVAGTIVFEIPDTDTIFIEPDAATNTFKYKDGIYTTDITTSTRILFNNIEGAGANQANGVYSLTALVDNGGSHTYTFTRTTDLNQVVELVQFVSVNVLSGTYRGKIYFLNSTIAALTEPQDWIDYGSTYLLSLYYPDNKLVVGDKLKVLDLKRGTVPQKLYNHLTRSEGLYVGTVSAVAPPAGSSPLEDTRNYFRLNPDVSMGEFIYNSFTNNYTIKNVPEAKLYGFNELKPGQIIIVPQTITKGITQLAETITYNRAVDTSTPGAYVYSDWTQPPLGVKYGESTMLNNNEYKTLSTLYDTAAVLDRLVTDDLKYIEIEYTGNTTDDLKDLYLGIVKPFTPSLFKMPFMFTEGGADTMGWAHPTAPVFGAAVINSDGGYQTGTSVYDTAVVINEKLFDGAFVTIEKSFGASALMKLAFGTMDQATYEAINTVSANWARDYPQVTANENILMRLQSTTNIRKAFNGGAAVDVVVDAVPDMDIGGRIAVAIGAVNTTKINLGVKFLDNTGTTILDYSEQFTVASSADWFNNTDRYFYFSSTKADDTCKPIYLEEFPDGLPTDFISVGQQVNIPLSMPWSIPLNYKFGNGSVIENVYNPTDKYDTAFLIDTPIKSKDWAAYRQFGTTDSIVTQAYFGFIDRDAFQSLVIDTGLPQSAYDNWTIQQKITKNEGVLISLKTDTNHQVPLSLIDDTPIGLPSGYDNNQAVLVDGVYSTNSDTYNTAAVMYTTPDLDTKYSFIYQGTDTLTPSAYFGMINKERFKFSLSNFSPLFLTTKAGWDTPADFQYGNAEINEDGQYTVAALEGNTAAIIKTNEGGAVRISYNGPNGVNPTNRFGFIDKSAFERNSKEIDPLVVPFVSTKDIWNLPSEFDNVLKAAPITGGRYKSNVAKYASAAIINDSIQDGIKQIVYVGTTERYPKAVFGFISQTAYEAMPVSAVGDNWANSLDITDNEGVLIEILRPEDPRNTDGTKQQLLVKYNNATTTNHTFNSDKILPKFDSQTVIMLSYQPSDPTTIYIYLEIWSGDGNKLFATYEDLSGGNQIDITVADSTAWYTDKKTYITVNNKSEKYVSDPTYSLSKLWTISSRNTYEDGILFEIIDGNNPTNTILTNSVLRYSINGKYGIVDLGSAITFNDGNFVILGYSVTSPTTVDITIIIRHSTGPLVKSVSIDNIIDSSTWINNKNTYVVNYVPDYKWSTTSPSNWANNQVITDDRGFLFRILDPTNPLNPHAPNTAIEQIIDAAAPVYIDLGAAIADLTTDSAITMRIRDFNPTTKRINLSATNKSTLNTETFLFGIDIDLTIADAAEFADWQNTVVPYITTNSSTESYKSNVSMNIRALYDNTEYYDTVNSPLYDQVIIPDGGLAVCLETIDATTINIYYGRFDLELLTLIQPFIYSLTVTDSSTWYENKRFFITTNNPLEKYYSDNYPFYFPFGSISNSAYVGGSAVRSINDEVNSAGENWTNKQEVSKNEGVLTQFDFGTGTGTGFDNNVSSTLTSVVSIAGNTIDKGGYIQFGYERNVNDINYEIIFMTSNDTKIGEYTGTLTTADGAAWLAEKTKRFYLTTNDTNHTFKSTSNPHSYAGSISVTGFIDAGNPNYEVFTSDITNIIPRRSFTIAGRNVLNITDFIINLTGQELDSLNKLYMLESMDDIKSTGIRLTENNLIFPLAFPTLFIPSRVFKLPIRMRRVLRRITQMAGI